MLYRLGEIFYLGRLVVALLVAQAGFLSPVFGHGLVSLNVSCETHLSNESSERQDLIFAVDRITHFLPTTLEELLIEHPGRTIGEIAQLIRKRQKHQASTLLDWSNKIDEDSIFRQALLKTNQHLLRPDYDDLADQIKFEFSNAYFPTVHPGDSLFAQLKNIDDPDLYKAYKDLNKLIGTHGFLAELRWALKVKGFVRMGAKVRELVSLQVMAELTRRYGIAEARAMAEKEIDIVFNGGGSWLEVKNQRCVASASHSTPCYIRATTIKKILDVVHQVEGRKIEMVYLFLRGGIERSLAQQFERLGFHVRTAELLETGVAYNEIKPAGK